MYFQQQEDLNELVTYSVENEPFIIPKKYKLYGTVGKGAYGIVCKAVNTINNEIMAIKKNKHVFPKNNQMEEEESTSLLIQMRILRELKILMHLHHENIISLKDVIKPSSIDEFNDVYYVFEFMDTNLSQVIKSTQSLTEEHVQYIMYQILLGLQYIHSADILHRDLKPANILLNSSCQVKICDFGLARGIDFKTDPTMSTTFIQTRWYRAPEMILNHPTVTKQVDMWSVGCILAELIGRKPIFPGSSPLDQLKRICQVCGTPNFKDVPGDEKTIKVMFSQLSFYTPIDLSLIYPNVSKDTLDLLAKMLQFQPNNRISAEDALKHPYFKSLYSPDHLEKCEEFDSSFEKLTKSYGIKSVMFESLIKYGEKNHKRKNREEEQEEFMDLVSPIQDLITDFLSDSESPEHKKGKTSNDDLWFY
eukprot:gene9239-1325_t